MITEQQILKKYPKIFGDKDLPPTKTCMCWGLEVPDEWLPVIDQLCDCLQNGPIWLDGNLIKRPQVVADQVKSKFDELRFYYHLDTTDCFREGVTDEKRQASLAHIRGQISGMIQFAEHLVHKLEKEYDRTLIEQDRPVK